MSKSWAKGKPKNWDVIKRRILKRDNYQCQLCGETEGELHLDHIVPRRLVDDESDANLQILCKRCNLQKGGSFFDTPANPRLFPSLSIPKNASVSHE